MALGRVVMEIGYRVGNLRRLVRTDSIKLKPITILVGRNSAGKSTFLRTFPLLKQSLATRSSAPVLWYGHFVDFGDFKTSVNNNDESKLIEFSFTFHNVEKEVVRLYNSGFRRRQTLTTKELLVTYFVGLENDKTVLHSIRAEMPNEKISTVITLTSKDALASIKVGNFEFLNELSGKLLSDNNSLFTTPLLFNSNRSSKADQVRGGNLLRFFENRISNILREEIPKNVGWDTILRERYRILSASELTIQSLKDWAKQSRTQAFSKFYTKFSERLTKGVFSEIVHCRNAYLSFVALEFADVELSETFSGVSYLGPARARSERYYRKQELEVSEISSDGQNFPMFLSSLSKQRLSEFSHWVKGVFGYGIEIKDDSGHTSIFITSDEEIVNVTDTGYGVSQLLPVLAQVWWSTIQRRKAPAHPWAKVGTKTIVIEQPELHLHPAHQGLLADVFVKAIKTSSTQKIRLIVETHSEAMINKLGALVERGDISPEDVQIVVFGAEDAMNSPAHVTVAQYDSDGVLKNWPYGFFEYL